MLFPRIKNNINNINQHIFRVAICTIDHLHPLLPSKTFASFILLGKERNPYGL